MPMLGSVLESRIQDLVPELERVYKDIHAHPELSLQETRTARIAADHLRGTGYEVTDGMIGIEISIKATWGRWSIASSTASRPLSASATTFTALNKSSTRSDFRISLSSSAIRTVNL